jgi:hypothetical protein
MISQVYVEEHLPFPARSGYLAGRFWPFLGLWFTRTSSPAEKFFSLTVEIRLTVLTDSLIEKSKAPGYSGSFVRSGQTAKQPRRIMTTPQFYHRRCVWPGDLSAHIAYQNSP